MLEYFVVTLSAWEISKDFKTIFRNYNAIEILTSLLHTIIIGRVQEASLLLNNNNNLIFITMALSLK